MKLQTSHIGRREAWCSFRCVQSASRRPHCPHDQPRRCTQLRRSRAAGVICRAAAADADDGSSDDWTGSEEWRQRPAAVALPAAARQPESWFMMAGFLKCMLMATTSYGFLIPGGRPDLLTLLPIGFGLMFLANLVLQRDLQRRRWFSGILLVVSVGAIAVIRALVSDPTEPVRSLRPPVAPAPTAAQAARQRRLPTAEDAEAMGIKWDAPRPTRPDDTL